MNKQTKKPALDTSSRPAGSILITMEITDPETVEEYSKCDSSFIVDDLIYGNLMKMCNVTSIKSNERSETHGEK